LKFNTKAGQFQHFYLKDFTKMSRKLNPASYPKEFQHLLLRVSAPDSLPLIMDFPNKPYAITFRQKFNTYCQALRQSTDPQYADLAAASLLVSTFTQVFKPKFGSQYHPTKLSFVRSEHTPEAIAIRKALGIPLGALMPDTPALAPPPIPAEPTPQELLVAKLHKLRSERNSRK
jgi:hypothetical protein